MFDDLRQDALSSELEEEEEPKITYREANTPPPRYFLGMTPVQRFILSLMLLMATCVLLSMLLLISGRVLPPVM